MMMTTALICVSLNVYHESRGDPLEGQVAVALVTYNRVRESGTTACEVVTKKGQFSWTTTGVKHRKVRPWMTPSDQKAWQKAQMVASATQTMWDYTLGSTHYHEVSIRPKWAESMEYVGTWGGHKFYRPRKLMVVSR